MGIDRKQVRLIAEGIDPALFGTPINEAEAHPIDMLIADVQKNMIKWNWNDNKFIRAMRNAYHAAGQPVPKNPEVLINDLQQHSEQDPKLLDKLISGLGGMTRRKFMGTAGGLAAGAAVGGLGLKGPERAKVDKTLTPNKHYRITYRNFRNNTLLFKDLIFHTAGGSMYWFMDPNRPRALSPYKPPEDPRQAIEHSKRIIASETEILQGRKPFKTYYQYQDPTKPKYVRTMLGRVVQAPGKQVAKYVKSNWVGTIERLKHRIRYHQNLIQFQMRRFQQGARGDTRRKYKFVTLQIENVVDIEPL